ncbi:MAG: response regulator transcription factor [Anaerolineae bacterium]|nr:response regulator transcription factor [Anaerolineae bacterium]
MTNSPVIRVMIVDDHPQVRRGLGVFLELWDDFLFVGEADNGEKAVALVEELQPHVILMDLVMPVMDGVTATRIIRHNYPNVQIVVLTSTIDIEVIQEALDAGAKTYMLKNVTIDTMAKTIRSAASD